MLNNLLILDTETTGLSPEEGDKIIELAAIVYNVPSKTVIQQISTLYPVLENPQINVNKIPADVSRLHEWRLAAVAINEAAKFCDVVVAHNADFDKQWITAAIGTPAILEKPWLCSCHDFVWPHMKPGAKSLINIAVFFGVPVISAHRALADCQLLADCFTKVPDLGARLDAAMQPKHLYKANVSFDEKQLAKDAGFIWNELYPKAWARKLSDDEAAEITFSIEKITT